MVRAAAARWQGRLFLRRYLYPVAKVMVFLAGILAAARLGIMLADLQVPPGLVSSDDQIKAGSRWEIHPAMGFAVSEHLDDLREYDFRSSGGGPVSVEGVSLFEVAEAGVELEILAGSDRRYLKVQVRQGEYDGETFWLMMKEFRKMAITRRP